VLAPTDDQLPRVAVTHLSSLQTPTIATSHEDTGSISYMMEEPCVRDVLSPLLGIIRRSCLEAHRS
jgi:hypothetical protein